MAREIVTKAAFERAYQKLSESHRELVDDSLRRFEIYLRTREASGGLGIKHLGSRTYEFRVGLSLRIVYVLEENRIILALLGTHDEVRRYLKHR